MNLTDDAMQVSLRITAWSGRLYDRQASNHVAVHHDAAASAGRYNKCLLPKTAFAALTATVSACRTAHYENTVPWDRPGLAPPHRRQLRALHRADERVPRAHGARARPLHRGLRTSTSTKPASTSASSSASRTIRPRRRFRTSSRSATASPRSRTPSSSWPSSRPTTWTGSSETSRQQIDGAPPRCRGRPLAGASGEAVERVSEAVAGGRQRQAVVFRDSMISKHQGPRRQSSRASTSSATTSSRGALRAGEGQDRERRAGIRLRPSKTFDPVARARVKRDADDLMEKFAGYFVTPVEPAREAA